MATVKNALIVGGGIGGLVAAIAMRRAGIDVDLVEIKSNWTVYGVGIIQPNNTLRALDEIGLAQACVDAGAPFPGWRIHDPTDAVLMAAESPNTAAPKYPPINGITRPKLHEILTQAARTSGAQVHLGVHPTGIVDEGAQVRVTFNNGETRGYEFVLGADGVYSATREWLFPQAPKPRFTGQSVWRYNLPRPADMVWGEVHFGAKTKLGLVPLGPKLMYMFLVTHEPGNPRLSPETLADAMRERLEGYSRRIGRLRDLITDPAGVVYKPMESVLLPGPWHRGRCLIIGDAAHATTPHLAQGAAMAIEDAVLLGQLLARGSNLPQILDEFMRRRETRAAYVVNTSDQLAEWELEQWRGVVNPDARPGPLLHEAGVRLMDPY